MLYLTRTQRKGDIFLRTSTVCTTNIHFPSRALYFQILVLAPLSTPTTGTTLQDLGSPGSPPFTSRPYRFVIQPSTVDARGHTFFVSTEGLLAVRPQKSNPTHKRKMLTINKAKPPCPPPEKNEENFLYSFVLPPTTIDVKKRDLHIGQITIY